jgi:hypothetical protein
MCCEISRWVFSNFACRASAQKRKQKAFLGVWGGRKHEVRWFQPSSFNGLGWGPSSGLVGMGGEQSSPYTGPTAVSLAVFLSCSSYAAPHGPMREYAVRVVKKNALSPSPKAAGRPGLPNSYGACSAWPFNARGWVVSGAVARG